MKQKNKNSLAIFDNFKIRRIYNEKNETWYFSVVDIIQALEVSSNARNYWKVLKSNLRKEGSEVVTKINQLKMMASDKKYYKTDSADVETLLRLIQSVPDNKATHFRIWATERLKEYIIKGFTMDDERLKTPNYSFGQDYFEEQLARIADIRSSERRFYQKITDIYAQCSRAGQKLYIRL